MNFENIDLRTVDCFGYSSPKDQSWLSMLKKATEFSRVQDKEKMMKSFASNVESSYYRLCGFTVIDLDTDITYFASFVNGWKQWDLEIQDSTANIDISEKKAFFSTDLAKKVIKRSAKYIEDALAAYESSLKQQVESGEFIEVDENKLASVIKNASSDDVMNAFKKPSISSRTFS